MLFGLILGENLSPQWAEEAEEGRHLLGRDLIAHQITEIQCEKTWQDPPLVWVSSL